MRRMAPAVVTLSLALVTALISQAGGDDANAIISKAIKAHFPKGFEAKQLGLRTKGKGTLHVMGLDLEFTQETAVQVPTKFKEVMEFTVMGKKITTTTVFDGKKGWIKANDKDVDVTKEILDEFKEVVYFMGLTQGMFLKDKALKFSLLGEVQVNGKPAVGVKVSRDGKKDANLYFDKGTGLMTKVELRKRDFANGQEVTEERLITEYQEVAGRKVAKKVEIKRDGKTFLELEVLEPQFLERLDDSEFTKPE
jgi:hypothetical protein